MSWRRGDGGQAGGGCAGCTGCDSGRPGTGQGSGVSGPPEGPPCSLAVTGSLGVRAFTGLHPFTGLHSPPMLCSHASCSSVLSATVISWDRRHIMIACCIEDQKFVGVQLSDVRHHCRAVGCYVQAEEGRDQLAAAVTRLSAVGPAVSWRSHQKTAVQGPRAARQ